MEKVNREKAEHYIWGKMSEGWHFLKRDDLSIILEEVPPGESESKHFHNNSRQFFFIISGKAEMEFDSHTVHLEENEGIEVSPGVAHRFKNTSDKMVTFLVVSMPGSHGDRINI